MHQFNGSVLCNTVEGFKSMKCLPPQPLRVNFDSLALLFHLASEEALPLAVRLSASEARKDSALILELMLG